MSEKPGVGRVAVVGAGIAGLTCAYELQRGGASVEVYEREATVGGRMKTRTKDHLAFDLGANFLVRSYGCVRALAQELQVPLIDLGHVRHAVCRDDHSAPLNFNSILDVFKLAGLSTRSRLRLLAFSLKVRKSLPGLDFFELSNVPEKYNLEDSYSYARKQISQEFADYVVDAFNSCMMFSRSSETSAAAFLALFSMMANPACDFGVCHARGEMSAIPVALAARLPVRTLTAVLSIQRTNGVWQVTTRHTCEHYDRLVIATTAGPALALLGKGPHSHLSILESTRYASTLNVSFRIPRGALGSTHCFYVPYLRSSVISEFTNEFLKGECTTSDGWSLVNVGLHEQAGSKLLDAPDGQVYDFIASELLKLSPELRSLSKQVIPHDLQRWPEAIPKYDCGHIRRVKEFQCSGQGDCGLYLCGDYLNAPWTEGACRSGKNVARLVLSELKSGSARTVGTC